MTLEYIQHCGAEWIVGLNGQRVPDQIGGGTLGGVPYVAIAGDEMGDPVPELSCCPKCGRVCLVETARSKGRRLGDD